MRYHELVDTGHQMFKFCQNRTRFLQPAKCVLGTPGNTNFLASNGRVCHEVKDVYTNVFPQNTSTVPSQVIACYDNQLCEKKSSINFIKPLIFVIGITLAVFFISNQSLFCSIGCGLLVGVLYCIDLQWPSHLWGQLRQVLNLLIDAFSFTDQGTAQSLAATRAGWERKREYYIQSSESNLGEALFVWNFSENLAACWQAMSGKDSHAKAVHLRCMPRYHLVFLLTSLKSILECRCFGKQTMHELRWFFQNILGYEKPNIFSGLSPEENIVVIKNLIRQRLLLIHPDKYNENYIRNSQNKESLLQCAERLYAVIDIMRVLMNDEIFSYQLCAI